MSAVISVPTTNEEIISYNPSTGAEVGRLPITSGDEVAAAVERARTAFQTWKKTSFQERASLIMRAREVILSQVDEIAHLISDESGKPFGEAISIRDRLAKRLARFRRDEMGDLVHLGEDHLSCLHYVCSTLLK